MSKPKLHAFTAHEVLGEQNERAIVFRYKNQKYSGLRRINAADIEISKASGFVGDVTAIKKLIYSHEILKLLP